MSDLIRVGFVGPFRWVTEQIIGYVASSLGLRMEVEEFESHQEAMEALSKNNVNITTPRFSVVPERLNFLDYIPAKLTETKLCFFFSVAAVTELHSFAWYDVFPLSWWIVAIFVGALSQSVGKSIGCSKKMLFLLSLMYGLFLLVVNQEMLANLIHFNKLPCSTIEEARVVLQDNHYKFVSTNPLIIDMGRQWFQPHEILKVSGSVLDHLTENPSHFTTSTIINADQQIRKYHNRFVRSTHPLTQPMFETSLLSKKSSALRRNITSIFRWMTECGISEAVYVRSTRAYYPVVDMGAQSEVQIAFNDGIDVLLNTHVAFCTLTFIIFLLETLCVWNRWIGLLCRFH